MKHVLLSFCLTTAALSAPTPVHFTRALCLDGDVAMGTAISSTLNFTPSTETLVVPSDQYEVHAVVVDMPQRASLAHASPETWDTLPMSDPPYEQSPATTVLQVALN
jgi:hypothetical protein